MNTPSLYTLKIKALNKTIALLFIVYTITAFVLIYQNGSTQKEIQANIYGVKIESDGKGALPTKQKPYICIEKYSNLIYTHECSLLSWIATILVRVFFTFFLTWVWFLTDLLRALILLGGGIGVFSIFYFFGKKNSVDSERL